MRPFLGAAIPYFYDNRATRAGCCLPLVNPNALALGKCIVKLSSAQSEVEQGHVLGELPPKVPVSTSSIKVDMKRFSEELAGTANHNGVPDGFRVRKINRQNRLCLRIEQSTANAHCAYLAKSDHGAVIGEDPLTNRFGPMRAPYSGATVTKAKRTWLAIAVLRTMNPVSKADPDFVTVGSNRLPVQYGTGADNV